MRKNTVDLAAKRGEEGSPTDKREKKSRTKFNKADTIL